MEKGRRSLIRPVLFLLPPPTPPQVVSRALSYRRLFFLSPSLWGFNCFVVVVVIVSGCCGLKEGVGVGGGAADKGPGGEWEKGGDKNTFLFNTNELASACGTKIPFQDPPPHLASPLFFPRHPSHYPCSPFIPHSLPFLSSPPFAPSPPSLFLALAQTTPSFFSGLWERIC